MLNGLESISSRYFCSDKNLPLKGFNSIVGRSVVIHKEDGTRWGCANIEDGPYKLGQEEMSAVASFTNGDLVGYVRFVSFTLMQYLRCLHSFFILVSHYGIRFRIWF